MQALPEMRELVLFLSTPSARRATVFPQQSRWHEKISIHALREEGDRTPKRTIAGKSDFYPRPPRGGRQLDAEFAELLTKFLSTPSARRATC